MSIPTPTKLLSYDSANRRFPALYELVNLFQYGELLRLLIVDTLKTRYKRSALGVLWTLLNPFLNMVVLSIAFSSLFRNALPHYPVYVLIGVLCWNFFTQTSLFAIDTLVLGNDLLRRIYVPRTIFAFASLGNGIINIALSLIPLVLIMVLLGHPFYPTWWFLPFGLLLLAFFTLGIILLISTIAIFFGDTVHIYQVLIQAWFFLTPIMYPLNILPENSRWMMNLNPLYYFVELIRLPLYEGHLPDPLTILIAFALSLVVLVGGWVIYTSKADEFAYRT